MNMILLRHHELMRDFSIERMDAARMQSVSPEEILGLFVTLILMKILDTQAVVTFGVRLD